MKKFISVIDGISTWAGKCISLIMLPIVTIVCYEVTMRYIFHRPTIWASEAMVFGCGFLYVLGASWTLLDGRHVKIDFLWEKFSPRGRAILDCFNFLLFMFYMGMLLWVGSKYAWDSIQLRETFGTPWNPPVYPVKISFVIGVCMLILQGIADWIRDLYFAITGEHL
jgi:TRAP-type mannitol/chloroaromatic compound transport system permease small subunit